jgi:hypothetical protein
MRLIDSTASKPGWVVGVLCLLAATSCTDRNDPAVKAWGYKVGRTEEQLRREAGSPALTRRVNKKDKRTALDLCDADSANPDETLLEYHFPSRGSGYYFQKLFNLGPSVIIVVCVDRNHRVTSTHEVQF